MTASGTKVLHSTVQKVNIDLMNKEIINWLLQGDPSVQYQTTRDLLDGSEKDCKVLQNKISEEGWGKKFLSFQDKSGLWADSLYNPKWTSTHYTLMTLAELGLPSDNRQAKKGCKILLDRGFYSDGGINYFASLKHSETCVSAMTLTLLSYFEIDDSRRESIFNFVLNQQMKDGGWNCESFKGAVHSSFHTTISVLEALRMYEKKVRPLSEKIIAARKKAHDFLLQHHLFKSDKTNKIIDQKMTRFSFPPRWRYDLMRALDYFREINMPHDPRFCDAVTLLKKKEKNGKWPLQNKQAGRMFFEMEKVGQPGRINTLRALRILKWWNTKPNEIICSK